jgi:hypothetical protein
MRVYERKYNYLYPEDMKMILNYLNEHGKILVSDSDIEDLYCDFSDEKYCASWMGVNEQMLEEFEDWLEHYNEPRYF